jgi:S-adenosylmethionine decarboxylase
MVDVRGFHIIADLSQCQALHEIDNEAALIALLLECAKEANATVLSVNTHKFHPEGISGFVFLAESHISVHVWPEAEYVSFDCYTCGSKTQPWRTIEVFAAKTKPQYQTITEVQRGVSHFYVENAYSHQADELGFSSVEYP